MSPKDFSGEKNHQLPDGSWVSLRIESDPFVSKWTYLWITFVTGKVRPAWYRVFPVGTLPGEWRRLKRAGAVDKQTGIEEADSDKEAEETRRENEGKVGAARELKAGRYVLQSKISVGETEVELTIVEFQVSRGVSDAGWG
jgi:hypothetical protein